MSKIFRKDKYDTAKNQSIKDLADSNESDSDIELLIKWGYAKVRNEDKAMQDARAKKLATNIFNSYKDGYKYNSLEKILNAILERIAATQKKNTTNLTHMADADRDRKIAKSESAQKNTAASNETTKNTTTTTIQTHSSALGANNSGNVAASKDK